MHLFEKALRFMLVGCLLLLAGACSAVEQVLAPGQSPAQGYRYLELLLEEDFADGGGWRDYAADELFLGVEDGAYKIDFVGRKYVWTQGDAQYTDVVVEADFEQNSDYDHNAFGLACRLDPANSGRGYFFLISGDGYASIRWSNGRSLVPIVAVRPSAPVNRGEASNRLRAVCVGDYLALWVNDEFVVEARDRRASAGAVGLVAVMNYAGQRLTVSIDDLKLWRAAPDDRGL